MTTMQQVVLIGHTLIAILIILLVLLQRGKGADAGAGFGAGASGTVFGARGSSSFFSRATAILATAFFVSSLTLAYLSSQQHETGPSSLLDVAPAVEQEAEAVPVDDGEVEVPLPGSVEEPAEEAMDALPSLDEETPAEDASADEDATTE